MFTNDLTIPEHLWRLPRDLRLSERLSALRRAFHRLLNPTRNKAARGAVLQVVKVLANFGLEFASDQIPSVPEGTHVP